MWTQFVGYLSRIGITEDAIFIVGVLGGLEIFLYLLSWFTSVRVAKEQTELLEDLVVTLTAKEQKDDGEK